MTTATQDLVPQTPASPAAGDHPEPQHAGPQHRTPTRWADMLDELTAFIAEHGHARIPEDYRTENGRFPGRWLNEQRKAHRTNLLDDERAAQLAALLGPRWATPHQAYWDAMFAALTQFVAQHGHARVPQNHVSRDGTPLGTWVGNQRSRHQQNTLDPARAARLETLPGWAWNGNAGHEQWLEQRWEHGFTALTQYVAEHGHANVARLHITTDNFRLGDWVDNQRASHQDNRLNPARAARLAALPGWVWRESREDLWERLYATLGAYVAEHGHARFPNDYITSDGIKLGQWARDQRRKYRQGRVNAERVARLEATPGWTWSDRLDEQWERGFTALTQFVDEHGHANVESRHTCSDSFHLGDWVSAQRRKHHRGELDDGRAARLEALPGWVWRRRDRTPGVYCGWDGRFRALTQFVDEHGHARVPHGHISADRFRLGQWVNTQRYTYRQGALDPRRTARLQALPGWVWNSDAPGRQVNAA